MRSARKGARKMTEAREMTMAEKLGITYHEEIVEYKNPDGTIAERVPVLIPDLELPDQPERIPGKYGDLRLKYLKENEPMHYDKLAIYCELSAHLNEVQEKAFDMVWEMTEKIAAQNGATEDMKDTDMLRWAAIVSNAKATAEQQVIREYIMA
jgi:hypothetical protein